MTAKKIFTAFLISSAVFCLTSCSHPRTKDDTNSGSGGDQFPNISLTAAEFANDKKHIIIEPDAKEFYTMKLKHKESAGSKEELEIFEKYYTLLLSDKLTPEEKENEFRFIVDEIPMDTETKYPYCYPRVCDHIDELNRNKYAHTYLYIDCSKCKLDVMNGALHIFEGGDAYALENKGADSHIGMYFPDDHHDMTAWYLSADAQDSYQLKDSSVTVSDAAKSAVKYIDELYAAENNDFTTDVSNIYVIKLGEKNGYSLRIVKKYKGVPFDSMLYPDTGGVGYKTISNGKKYDMMPGYAFIYDSAKIDILIGHDVSYQIEESKKLESIITREEGLKAVSEKFSDDVYLNIYKEELVYTCEKTNDTGTELSVRPAWKFSAKDQNSKDLFIYVDAVTKDCWYVEPDLPL